MKRFLLILACVFSLIAAAIIYIIFASRDIPEPDTSDLLVPTSPVPDENNAFTYFAAAARNLYWPTNASLVSDILSGKTNDEAFVSNLIGKNTGTFRLIEQGLTCNTYQAPQTTNFYAGKWRNIGKAMALKAMHEQKSGLITNSLQTHCNLIRFSDILQGQAADIAHYLSAYAILEEIALDQTRHFAYSPDIQENQLVLLSESLTKLTPCDRGLIHVFKKDFCYATNMINDINMGRLDSLGMEHFVYRKIPTFFFQPNRTKLAIANIYRDMIKDAPRVYGEMKSYGFENVFDLKGNKIKLLVSPNIIGKIIYVTNLTDPDILLEVKCRMECSINATRLILACKAYEKQEHKLPPSLEALIPKYIEAVPRDPYDGKPLRYCPSKGIVYSVGKDLQDSNGSSAVLTNAPCEWLWYQEDIAFGIDDKNEPKKERAIQAPLH